MIDIRATLLNAAKLNSSIKHTFHIHQQQITIVMNNTINDVTTLIAEITNSFSESLLLLFIRCNSDLQYLHIRRSTINIIFLGQAKTIASFVQHTVSNTTDSSACNLSLYVLVRCTRLTAQYFFKSDRFLQQLYWTKVLRYNHSVLQREKYGLNHQPTLPKLIKFIEETE